LIKSGQYYRFRKKNKNLKIVLKKKLAHEEVSPFEARVRMVSVITVNLNNGTGLK